MTSELTERDIKALIPNRIADEAYSDQFGHYCYWNIGDDRTVCRAKLKGKKGYSFYTLVKGVPQC